MEGWHQSTDPLSSSTGNEASNSDTANINTRAAVTDSTANNGLENANGVAADINSNAYNINSSSPFNFNSSVQHEGVGLSTPPILFDNSSYAAAGMTVAAHGNFENSKKLAQLGGMMEAEIVIGNQIAEGRLQGLNLTQCLLRIFPGLGDRVRDLVAQRQQPQAAQTSANGSGTFQAPDPSSSLNLNSSTQPTQSSSQAQNQGTNAWMLATNGGDTTQADPDLIVVAPPTGLNGKRVCRRPIPRASEEEHKNLRSMAGEQFVNTHSEFVSGENLLYLLSEDGAGLTQAQICRFLIEKEGTRGQAKIAAARKMKNLIVKRKTAALKERARRNNTSYDDEVRAFDHEYVVEQRLQNLTKKRASEGYSTLPSRHTNKRPRANIPSSATAVDLPESQVSQPSNQNSTGLATADDTDDIHLLLEGLAQDDIDWSANLGHPATDFSANALAGVTNQNYLDVPNVPIASIAPDFPLPTVAGAESGAQDIETNEETPDLHNNLYNQATFEDFDPLMMSPGGDFQFQDQPFQDQPFQDQAPEQNTVDGTTEPQVDPHLSDLFTAVRRV